MRKRAFGAGEFPVVPIGLRKKFESHIERCGDRHLVWTGSRHSKRGTPFMYYEREQISAASVAFILRTGEWPQGSVRRLCDVHQCVSPDCVEDDAGVERVRDQLIAMGLMKRRRR